MGVAKRIKQQQATGSSSSGGVARRIREQSAASEQKARAQESSQRAADAKGRQDAYSALANEPIKTEPVQRTDTAIPSVSERRAAAQVAARTAPTVSNAPNLAMQNQVGSVRTREQIAEHFGVADAYKMDPKNNTIAADVRKYVDALYDRTGGVEIENDRDYEWTKEGLAKVGGVPYGLRRFGRLVGAGLESVVPNTKGTVQTLAGLMAPGIAAKAQQDATLMGQPEEGRRMEQAIRGSQPGMLREGQENFDQAGRIIEAAGGNDDLYSQVVTMAAQNAPDMILSMGLTKLASAGGGAVAQAGAKQILKGLAKKETRKAALITLGRQAAQAAIPEMSTLPMGLKSFAMTYQDSKAKGADDAGAMAAAFASAWVESAIEAGGAQDVLKNAERGFKAWAKGALGEGAEELWQDWLAPAAEKYIAGVQGIKGFSMNPQEDSIFNPVRAGTAALGGAVIGGAVGLPSIRGTTAAMPAQEDPVQALARHMADRAFPEAVQADREIQQQQEARAETSRNRAEAVANGKPVTIPGFEEVQTAVVKKGDSYSVVEARTGTRIATGATPEAAAGVAARNLSEMKGQGTDPVEAFDDIARSAGISVEPKASISSVEDGADAMRNATPLIRSLYDKHARANAAVDEYTRRNNTKRVRASKEYSETRSQLLRAAEVAADEYYNAVDEYIKTQNAGKATAASPDRTVETAAVKLKKYPGANLKARTYANGQTAIFEGNVEIGRGPSLDAARAAAGAELARRQAVKNAKPIEARNMADMKDKNALAYQHMFPELREGIVSMASRALQDLSDGSKGEKIFVMDGGEATGTTSTVDHTEGVKRSQSALVDDLMGYDPEGGSSRLTYERLTEALRNIIEGNEKANRQIEKEVEQRLDHYLENGTTDFRTGAKVAPDAAYKDAKAFIYRARQMEGKRGFSYSETGLAEAEDALTKHADRMEKDFGFRPEMKIVDPKTTAQKNILRMLETVGLRAYFIEAKNEGNLAEYYDPNMPDVVFIKAGGKRDMQWAAGHAFFHSLKENHPSLFTASLDAFEKTVTAEQIQKYLDTFSETPAYQERLSDDKALLMEEMLADQMGNTWLDKGFWETLAEMSADVFYRLKQAVVDFFDAAMNGFENFLAKKQVEEMKTRFLSVTVQVQDRVAMAREEGTDPSEYDPMTEKELASDLPFSARKKEELTLWLSSDRVVGMMRRYASPKAADQSKAYATMISPSGYLSLTTNNEAAIVGESKDLDLGKLRESEREIILRYNEKTGEVTGHGGRHRMAALRDAGVEQVAIAIIPDGDAMKPRTQLDSLKLTGEVFRSGKATGRVTLDEVVPINRDSRDLLEQMFAYGGEGLQYSARSKDVAVNKFYESVKKNEATPKQIIDMMQDMQNTHRVFHNSEAIEQAAKAIADDYHAAYYNGKTSTEVGPVAGAIRFFFYSKAIQEQDWNEAFDWLDTLQKMGAKYGQAVQIYALLRRMTPEGAVSFAKRELDKSRTEAQKKRIDKESGEVQNTMDQINAGAADAIGQAAEKEAGRIAKDDAKEAERIAKDAEETAAQAKEEAAKANDAMKAAKAALERARVRQAKADTAEADAAMMEAEAAFQKAEADARIAAAKAREEAAKAATKRAQATAKRAEQRAGTAERKRDNQITPEEMLARRVQHHMKASGGSIAPDPIKAMVDALYQIASVQLPEKVKRLGPDAYKVVGDAIRNVDEYRRVWDAAKIMVKGMFLDDARALQELDAWFAEYLRAPFSQAQGNKIVERGLKDIGITAAGKPVERTAAASGRPLSEIVREHYTMVEAAGKSLLEKIKAETGLSGVEAAYLTWFVQDEFNQRTAAKKEQILSQKFGRQAAPRGMKTFVQQMIELSNLGALSSSKYSPLLAERLGIPAITQDIATKIQDYAEQIQTIDDSTEAGLRQRDILAAMMTAEIQRHVGHSRMDKILGASNLIQSFMMLSGPKSPIRNAVGNTLFGSVDLLKDVVAAGIDRAISAGTGSRAVPLPSVKSMVSGAKRGFKQGAEDLKYNIDTSRVNTMYELPKAYAWDSPVGRAMAKYLNATLRLPDRVFFEAAYQSHIEGLMRIEGATVPTEEMKERAAMFAARKTFNDDSAVAKALSGVKKMLNGGKAWGFGDFIVKFPRVPGNIISRGIEYSPLGMTRILYHLAAAGVDAKQAGEKYSVALRGHQAAISNAIAEGVIGTGTTIVLGAVLRSLGLITGDKDDDSDRAALMRAIGIGEYRINLSGCFRLLVSGFNPEAARLQTGDTLASYDWMQPLAVGISMGANIADAQASGKKGLDGVPDAIGTFATAFSSGMQTIADQPVFAGITRFMRNRNITDAVASTLSGVPATFIPAWAKYTRDLIDNTSRSTYSPNILQGSIYGVMNKIPGVHLQLPVYFDTLGNAKDTYQAGNNFFNVFFNPANMTEFKPTEEAMLALNTMVEAGNKNILPRSAYSYKSFTAKVDGKTREFELSPQEFARFQEVMGQYTKKEFEKISPTMPVKSRVKRMSDALNDAAAEAKDEIVKMRKEAGTLPDAIPESKVYDPIFSK